MVDAEVGVTAGVRAGRVYVYTGAGKGKTTAALGQVLRAAIAGKKVLFIQFMKGQETGELNAISKMGLPIEIKRFGRSVFLQRRPGQSTSRACEPLDILLAYRGLQAFEAAMLGGDYGLIALDEINVAMSFGLLRTETVLELVRRKPPWLELILTGRNAPAELLEMADEVTEMREVKHHYRRGDRVRKGIEF
jgi:cob(I)alamin adenosyltransferase